MRSLSSMCRRRPIGSAQHRSRAGPGSSSTGRQLPPADRTSTFRRRRRHRGRDPTRGGTRPGRGPGHRDGASAARRPSLATGSGSRHAGFAARSPTPSGRAACCSRPEGRETAAAPAARCHVGSRRAGPGSDGRSGTPCGESRRSRAPCRTACPLDRRSPRPSCWRNSVGLSVGRSIRTVSTAGTSTPSLKRSTENTARIRPSAEGRGAQPPARARGLSPQTATDVDAVAVEVLRHEAGVLDAHAEAEAAHRRRLGVVGHLLHDQAGPGVGAGVGGAQRLDVVAAAPPPRDVPEVEPIVDAEVEEGREVLLVDRVPQPQLGGDAIVEPVQDRQAVAALGCRGQAEQLDRVDVVEQPAVRRRSGVVELVDDDDVEVVGRQRRRGRWRSGSGSTRRRGRSASGRAPPTHFSPKEASRRA